MKRKLTILAALVAAIALLAPGCKKESDESAEPTAEEQEAAQEEQAADEPAERAERAERAAPKVIPVEAQMERVKDQITADNYKDELTKLEEEVNTRAERAQAIAERNTEQEPAAEEQPAEQPEGEPAPE